MATALIIGASSGIGRCLAVQLSDRGYELGLVARREPLLRDLARELPTRTEVAALDVTDLEVVSRRLPVVIHALGRLDLYIYCAGTGHLNPDLSAEPELETIAVNVQGFVNATVLVARVFEQQGQGHIVGISSIAGLRGGHAAPAYGASKAFMSNYLEALYVRYARAGQRIAVTDVQPGFVDTAMARSSVKFWVASPEKASRQIIDAILARKRKVYVTRRWQLYAWLMRVLPTRVLARLG